MKALCVCTRALRQPVALCAGGCSTARGACRWALPECNHRQCDPTAWSTRAGQSAQLTPPQPTHVASAWGVRYRRTIHQGHCTAPPCTLRQYNGPRFGVRVCRGACLSAYVLGRVPTVGIYARCNALSPEGPRHYSRHNGECVFACVYSSRSLQAHVCYIFSHTPSPQHRTFSSSGACITARCRSPLRKSWSTIHGSRNGAVQARGMRAKTR